MTKRQLERLSDLLAALYEESLPYPVHSEISHIRHMVELMIEKRVNR